MVTIIGSNNMKSYGEASNFPSWQNLSNQGSNQASKTSSLALCIEFFLEQNPERTQTNTSSQTHIQRNDWIIGPAWTTSSTNNSNPVQHKANHWDSLLVSDWSTCYSNQFEHLHNYKSSNNLFLEKHPSYLKSIPYSL